MDEEYSSTEEKLNESSSVDPQKLPLSLFNNISLSALELITKYVKEECGLTYSEIASLLNRDDRTIWGAYQSSQKKMEEPFSSFESRFFIPIVVLQDRRLSVLEAIIEYCKETLRLRYCEIAALLNRDDRTVWTVYKRVKKKRRMYVANA